MYIVAERGLAEQIVADIEACFALVDHGRQWRRLGMSPWEWCGYVRALGGDHDLGRAVARWSDLEALAEEIWSEPTGATPS